MSCIEKNCLAETLVKQTKLQPKPESIDHSVLCLIHQFQYYKCQQYLAQFKFVYNMIYALIYRLLQLGNLSVWVCLFLPRESDSIALYLEQISTRLGVSMVLLIF